MLSILFFVCVGLSYAHTKCTDVFESHTVDTTLLTTMLDERGVFYSVRGNRVIVNPIRNLSPLNTLASDIQTLFQEPLVMLINPTLNDDETLPTTAVFQSRYLVLLSDTLSAEKLIHILITDVKRKLKSS